MLAKIGVEKEDVCVWCFKTKLGVTVDFSDGLKGFLCYKDFRNAVKVRSNNESREKSKSDPKQDQSRQTAPQKT